jgi:hypothetical protein
VGEYLAYEVGVRSGPLMPADPAKVSGIGYGRACVGAYAPTARTGSASRGKELGYEGAALARK